MPAFALQPQERLDDGRVIAADATLGAIAVAASQHTTRVHSIGWRIVIGACAALTLLLFLGGEDALQNEPRLALRDWWLGIATGCLLVSGVILLAGVEWRCAVGRIGQTTALLATLVAGLLTILDTVGHGTGLAFRDAVDLACLLAVCAIFWFVGLLPDLATLRTSLPARTGEPVAPGLRDRPAGPRLIGRLAQGWRGSATQWQWWTEVYRTTALLACLLAVSFETASALRRAGAGDTMLPMTAIVESALSAAGLLAALVAAIRAAFRLDAFITSHHRDILARLLIAFGLAGLYCQAAAMLALVLSGASDIAGLEARLTDTNAWLFWSFTIGSSVSVQIFWLAAARRSWVVLGVIGIFSALSVLGAGLAASQPFPGAPLSAPGGLTLAGSIGGFLSLLLLCLRTLPAISIVETRALALRHNGEARTGSARPSARDGDEEETGARASHRSVLAAFASEPMLAAAARALMERDEVVRLDAQGPVPMPELVQALRLPRHPVRIYAVAGALLGGLAVFVVRPFGAMMLTPVEPGGRLSPFWPSLLVASVSVAMAVGTAALLAALLVRIGRDRSDLDPVDPARSNPFELTATVGGEEDDAGTEVARIERLLSGLPEDAGRPLAIRRLP